MRSVAAGPVLDFLATLLPLYQSGSRLWIADIVSVEPISLISIPDSCLFFDLLAFRLPRFSASPLRTPRLPAATSSCSWLYSQPRVCAMCWCGPHKSWPIWGSGVRPLLELGGGAKPERVARFSSTLRRWRRLRQTAKMAIRTRPAMTITIIRIQRQWVCIHDEFDVLASSGVV